jgi:peptidyl-prolyl cis-trans isomerase C
MADKRMNQTILMAIFVAFVAGAPTALPGSDAPEAAAEIPDGSSDPSEVFAFQGKVFITQQELDAAFSVIPKAQRLAFIRDGGKVDQLVKTLLRRKAVSADAERADFQKDPLVAARIRFAAQKELAEAWLEHVVSNAPEADFEALAREDYLVNPERYRDDGSVDVSHILIGTEERTDPEAKRLATSIHAWLEKEPSRFDELVEKYSDDPETVDNGGRYPEIHRGQTVPAFEQAAFGLQEPGMMSEPVKTPYGYHIIRLNARSDSEIPPFEAVREQAVAQIRLEYLESYRARYLQSLLKDPIVIPEGAVEIMARRHFGDDLDGAPDLAQ